MFFETTVEAENQSPSDWNSNTASPVSLYYHWIDERNDCIIFDGIRTTFETGILKNRSKITQPMKIEAPNKQGKFRLIATIVQDGVRWFNEPSFAPDSIEMEVI